MTSTAEHEDIVRGVMDRWKAAVDAHDFEQVATYFTQDAIFQGLHPYSVGPASVAEYYASQPSDMRAQYKILETRQIAHDVVLGYLGVEFSYADRPTRHVWISVLLKRTPSGWAIGHYQVSKLD